MTTPCNLPYQAVGPFSQTIFLGCSVVSFSMNLGWGKESSSCSVKLAKDYSSHYKSSVFNTINNALSTVNQRPGTQDSASEAFNNNDLNKVDNTSKSLNRNIIDQEVKKYSDINQGDIATLNPANIKDLGKKCWPTYIKNPMAKNWLSADPGFFGNKNDYNGSDNFDLDIIGCPVFFRFMDVWFGGMIKNWKYTNGEYDVELQSFASLLGGCVLILQHYSGSIATEILNTAQALANGNGKNLVVPYGDTSINIFNGTIHQGNIPNIFNVFGYLENIGFGSSGFVPDRGVSAGLIYDALNVLLNSNVRQQNQFNPYGSIVARTPLNRVDGALLDPLSTIYTPKRSTDGIPLNFADMGLIQAKMAVDGLFRSLLRLDLSAVPRPPNEAYISSETMDLISFIDYCCNNAGCDFYVDFEPDTQSSQYSGTIKIRTISRRIQYKPNTIKDFLLNFTPSDNVVDYSFGEEYSDSKTRSVLIGGPQERLHQFTTHTYSVYKHLRVFDPMMGSFVDMSNNVNIAQQIAGNNFFNTYRQPDHYNQRPLQGISWKARPEGSAVAQINNDFWSDQQSAYGNMAINRGSYLDTIKPSLNSSASTALPTESYPLYLDIISPYFGMSNDGEVRRTYLDTRTRQLQIVVDFRDIQALFPTAYDIRDGKWDTSYSQYISMYYPGQVTQKGWAGSPAGGAVGYGNFVITEQELRQAIGGQGQEPYTTWWSYTKDRAQYGYPTSLGRILYDYFSRAYNNDFAKAIFFLGLDWQKNISYYGYLQLVLLSIPGGVTSKLSQAEVFNPMAMERWAFINSGVEELLRSIHGFIKNIGDNHYGSTYAVRLPNIYSYADYTGKRRYSYEITDSAWEEVGNTIDDTTEVGSIVSSSFADDSGKIPAILGFDNTVEYYNKFTRLNSQNIFGRWTGAELRYSLIQSQLDAYYNNNNWYFPIDYSHLPADAYFTLPYTVYIGAYNPPGGRIQYSPFANTSTAFGFNPPDGGRWKLYVKADTVNANTYDEANPKIIYADGTPRVVLRTPSPLRIKSEGNLVSSWVDELLPYDIFGDQSPPGMDPVYSDFAGPAAPDNILHGTMFMRNIGAVIRTAAMAGALHPNEMLSSEGYQNISYRAPLPVFAAVPIRNNLMTYGPWVSHPGIIDRIVFPGYTDTNILRGLVNNLAGGVECQIDKELVPWNYGGMTALDQAALLKVTENNNFQQVLEYGSITLAGIMLNNSRLGSYFINGSLGPIVTSLTVSVGAGGGVNTKYDLRTFSRKLGFFNKEQADNIQKLSREILKTNQKIADSMKAATMRALSLVKGQ